MVTNDFLAFATGGEANVETQDDYAADPLLATGNQPGIAISAFNNKALRQACWIASVLAQFIANTSGDDVLDDGDSETLLASMALTWPGNTSPTQTILTTTGTATGYLFTVSSANATIGATYSNNTNIYTVLATIAGGTQLFCSGASAPTSSGTLTKQSGTGDSTITFSVATPLATYTPPDNVKYLAIKMVGAGAGGAGAATVAAGNAGVGGAGSLTVFGLSLLIAGGAAETGANGDLPGAPGAPTINAGATGIGVNGSYGQSGAIITSTSGAAGGASGGSSALGGNGCGGNAAGNAATAAAANTGSGGGGGAPTTSVYNYSGNGGSTGAFIDAVVPTPAASYYYAIGVGGTAGTAGTAGSVGAAGADGLIAITEYYTG